MMIYLKDLGKHLLKQWRYILLTWFRGEYLEIMRKSGFIWGREPTIDELYRFFYT